MYWCIHGEVGTTGNKWSLRWELCFALWDLSLLKSQETCMERKHSHLGVDQDDSSWRDCDWERFVKPFIENFQGFCHIFTNCKQKWILAWMTPPNWLGLMLEVCRNEEHFVSMVRWGAPKSERRTLLNPLLPTGIWWSMLVFQSHWNCLFWTLKINCLFML